MNPASKKWEKGTITEKLNHHSYEVIPDNGLPTHRNRVHLRPAESATTPEFTEDATENKIKDTSVDQYISTCSGRVVKPVKRLGFN